MMVVLRVVGIFSVRVVVVPVGCLGGRPFFMGLSLGVFLLWGLLFVFGVGILVLPFTRCGWC